MNTLVTGCAGFIGSHLTEALLEDGNHVVGVDCFNDNYGRAQKLRNLERAYDWDSFAFIPLDLARGDLGDLIDAVDVIFHLAAEPGVRPSWGGRFESYARNNILATQHLLEAAYRRGSPRFVYASSSSVYGQAEMFPTAETALPSPFSPYGVTKLAGEHLCLLYAANYGLPAVALRYFSVYGPRQRPDMAFRRFCESVLAREPLEVFGDGTQTRDFTYVADVVDATLAAARSAHETAGLAVNVGGGSCASLNDAIAILEALTGRPIDVRRATSQTGDVRDTAADIRLAGSRLGYAPKTDLHSGLACEWDWVQTTQYPNVRGNT